MFLGLFSIYTRRGRALFAPEHVALRAVILRRTRSTPANPDPRAPTHASKIISAREA